MTRSAQHVVFTLDDQRYALALEAVERVTAMVHITPLPKAPDIVLGVINVHGRIVPVVDIRKRFGLPQREITLTDQMILARTSTRPVVLIADAVSGVVELSAHDMVTIAEILPNLEYMEGVAKLEDGMVLIHDLDTFLSLEEDSVLDEAME